MVRKPPSPHTLPAGAIERVEAILETLRSRGELITAARHALLTRLGRSIRPTVAPTISPLLLPAVIPTSTGHHLPQP